MKLLLYITILGVMLLSLASAGDVDCPYTGGKATLEYSKCTLIKPVEPVVGDEIIVNCTDYEKVNNKWEKTPKAFTRVSITGYNEFDVALHGEAVNTRGDGTYKFVPRIPGRYLIQVMSCEYNAWFEVGEKPEVEKEEEDSGPTAAVVAELENETEDTQADEETVDTANEETVDTANEETVDTANEETADTADEEPPETNSEEEGDERLLDFVVEEDKEAAKSEISTFVLALIGLMVA